MALALHIFIPLNILLHVTTPEDIIILNVQWINTTAVKIKTLCFSTSFWWISPKLRMFVFECLCALRVPEEDDEGGTDGAHCCCLGDEKTGIVSRVCPALTIFCAYKQYRNTLSE